MSFEKGKINYNGEFISLKTAKYLSKEYLKSCNKFFKELNQKNKKRGNNV